MRIRVLMNYGGFNTQERRIVPGEYDVNDPALFGAADYLVQHGHAVPVESQPDSSNVIDGLNKEIADLKSKLADAEKTAAEIPMPDKSKTTKKR